jgi:hypothetical protein
VRIQLDFHEECLKMRRHVSAFLLAIATINGAVGAGAQGIHAPTELVVAWRDPVLHWNAVLQSIVGGRNPVEQQRIAAIAQLAVFEAVNAVTQRYEPYLGTVAAAPGASPEAAAIAAAHAVLESFFPEHEGMLDAARASSLARIAGSAAKDAGIALGEAAAEAITQHRLQDGSAPPDFHVPPSSDPGVWQLTSSCPPEGGPFLHLSRVVPFGLRRGDQFRAAPPPPLASRRYARDLNEVKAVGAVDSLKRPAARADVARFYAAVLGLQTWNTVARQLAVANKRSLDAKARVFALLNMALYDALIAVFESKYAAPFWRPETAIAGAAADGNPHTDPESGFEPFVTTPCHPSYPSAHASLGHAARAVLERTFGDGPRFIELTSPLVPGVKLRYTSLDQITDDIDDARIYGGIHFRFDQQAGGRQGRQVGTYIVRHRLRPVRGSHYASEPAAAAARE